MADVTHIPFDWDRAAVLTFGLTDLHITIQRMGEGVRFVGVPGGMTPREFAETIHGFDGYTVGGFGYGPDDQHPSDCNACMSGESQTHYYEAEK